MLLMKPRLPSWGCKSSRLSLGWLNVFEVARPTEEPYEACRVPEEVETTLPCGTCIDVGLLAAERSDGFPGVPTTSLLLLGSITILDLRFESLFGVDGTDGCISLMLFSCLSSAVGGGGDPYPAAPPERKNQLGRVLGVGIEASELVGRGVPPPPPSLTSCIIISAGPVLARFLRVPHFLTDPMRERRGDFGALEDPVSE